MPDPNTNATLSSYRYTKNLSAVPTAKWIWDGPANTSDCSMSISVETTFKSKCLNQPLTLWAAADNSYNATLSLLDTGTSIGTLSGFNWTKPNSLNISTVGMVCGNK